MIELKKIYLEESAEIIYLKADAIIEGEKQTLWYATARENKDYISTSNADAFILFIFIYCVFENLEFKSNVSISKRLKFGLIEVLLPGFREMGFKVTKNMFDFKLEDETNYPEASAIGTAMSFGVDSFFTFIKGQNSNQELNYLTLFNAGAFGNYGGSETELLFDGMKSRVENFAIQNKMGFIWVDTNLNEIFKMPFVETHTFRNFSCVLVFQKLFKSYFYASGISIENFKINKSDPGFYDLLNSKAIASNSIEFHISGLTESRLLKTKFIASKTITHENLNVCLVTSDYTGASLKTTIQNCSKCYKCRRTMVTLDVLGVLDNYKNVFDLKIYQKNKNKYLGELIYKRYRSNDFFAQEILIEAKKQNYNISIGVYYHALLRAIQSGYKLINRINS